MTLVPRHRILRIAATLWLLAAAVLLVVTLLRPEIQANERAALSTLVPLYWLSLPLGHLGVLALGRLKLDLIVAHQYVPGVFAEALALGGVLALLGYAQWFVLLPWLAGRCRSAVDFLSKRHPAR